MSRNLNCFWFNGTLLILLQSNYIALTQINMLDVVIIKSQDFQIVIFHQYHQNPKVSFIRKRFTKFRRKRKSHSEI